MQSDRKKAPAHRSNGGYRQSLVKSMRKQEARALAHEPCECVSALAPMNCLLVFRRDMRPLPPLVTMVHPGDRSPAEEGRNVGLAGLLPPDGPGPSFPTAWFPAPFIFP